MRTSSKSAEPMARRVWQAVNAVERRICGDGAVRSQAMAEGLALSGRRAARLIDPLREEQPSLGTAALAWVDHRVLRQGSPIQGAYAFELAAADGQQAVDHCLVAHLMATRIGRPGLCTVDATLAARPEIVRLPDTDWLQDLPSIRTVGADPLEEARAAFDSVSQRTGREVGPVSEFGLDGARCVLLAAGAGGGLALRAARELRQAGIPCGAMAFALLQPLDASSLFRIPASAEAIAVMANADDLHESLMRAVGAALVGDGRLKSIDFCGDDLGLLYRELEGQGVFDLAGKRPAPSGTDRPVIIGAIPADPRLDELLLDAVAPLAWIGSPRLDLPPAEDGVRSLVVGDRGQAGDRLDLLLAPGIAALQGVDLLQRLRECGTLLVRSSTDDPGRVWAALSAEQRAVLIRRRQRLCLIAPEGDHRDAIAGAVLAAVPQIAGTLGRSGAALDELEGLAPQPVLDRLREGARALVTADPARLGDPAEPVNEAGPAPRLPSPPDPIANRSSEWLLRFHFAGVDERDPAEPTWLGALRPAVLESPELTKREPAGSPARLYDQWSASVLTLRRRRAAELEAEAASLEERLRGMLGLPGRPSEDELGATLGRLGQAFLDPHTLQENLLRPHDAEKLAPGRRQRLEETLTTLKSISKPERRQPTALVLCPQGNMAPETTPDVEVVRHPDALRAAIGLFDGLASRAVELARAMRVARLEVSGSYDESTHDPILARLDWQSLTANERLWIPAVVILESARHLRGPALAAFSELIRAGRPIHVVVEDRVSDLGAETLEPPFGYHPGLGYLAVAHREALVVQSSLGRPQHLASGLAKAGASLDPVVIIAAVPSPVFAGSETDLLEAALQGRGVPCFVYDPAGGTSWADRFTLEGNPQPDRPWPTYPLTCHGETEEETTLEQSFTLAHAAALDPALRDHFRVIEPESWAADQVEIADYLSLTDRERSRRVPFVWVVRSGVLARAVLRWELAFAGRDRARAWRILQELAGTDNAHARRAADEARRETLEEGERKIEKLEADFAIALEASRGEGAAAAVGRLVQLLADPQGFEAASASLEAATLAAPPSVSLPAAPSATPTPPPAEAPAAVGGPYIDSFLCTTCNDCIDLNPQMFRYNENKQAEIADAAAGTFKQLVKAAEACPARCIHPGAPREGDTTATPALVKRAAKFN